MANIDMLEKLARDQGYMLVPLPVTKKCRWQQCAEFLRNLLVRGPQPAKTVYRLAAEAGFKASLVNLTKPTMRIRSRYHGRPGKRGYWVWELCEDEG